MIADPARGPPRSTSARIGSRILLLAVMALHGCGSAPTVPSATPVPPPAVPAPSPATLAVERQWLQSWFKDTPVRIEQRSESSFSVEVPRDFCFDPGRSNVKPPLAAVLDKVAQSLQRKPQLRLQLIAAPGDAAAASELAEQRAIQVRKHLLARGASSDQLTAATVTAAPAVQLRIGVPAP